MRIGCLILSILGLLFSFYLIADGLHGIVGNGIAGIILIAICGIYIVTFIVQEARKGKASQLVGQAGTAQPQPQQYQPGAYTAQSGVPSGTVACVRCGMVYPSSASWCVHCAIPLPEPEQPEEEEAYEPPLQQPQLPHEPEQQRGSGLTTSQGGLFIPQDESDQ